MFCLRRLFFSLVCFFLSLFPHFLSDSLEIYAFFTSSLAFLYPAQVDRLPLRCASAGTGAPEVFQFTRVHRRCGSSTRLFRSLATSSMCHLPRCIVRKNFKLDVPPVSIVLYCYTRAVIYILYTLFPCVASAHALPRKHTALGSESIKLNRSPSFWLLLSSLPFLAAFISLLLLHPSGGFRIPRIPERHDSCVLAPPPPSLLIISNQTDISGWTKEKTEIPS